MRPTAVFYSRARADVAVNKFLTLQKLSVISNSHYSTDWRVYLKILTLFLKSQLYFQHAKL